MARELQTLLDDVREELRDRWSNYRDEFGYEDDVLHEIADSFVPVYYSELIDLADEDVSLATETPEVMPEANCFPGALQYIVGNLYERIMAALWETLEDLQSDEDEDEDA